MGKTSRPTIRHPISVLHRQAKTEMLRENKTNQVSVYASI